MPADDAGAKPSLSAVRTPLSNNALGAGALATSLDHPEPRARARRAAEVLIDAAAG